MNYAQIQRLRLTDFLIKHYGSVARAEIEDFFGVGDATATRDFDLCLTKLISQSILASRCQ